MKTPEQIHDELYSNCRKTHRPSIFIDNLNEFARLSTIDSLVYILESEERNHRMLKTLERMEILALSINNEKLATENIITERKDFKIKCQWQYPKFNKKGKVKR